MAMVEYDVYSIVERQLTGKIGGSLLMKGLVSYRVNLVNGEPPICLRDGLVVEASHNATMTKLVTSTRQFFNV